MMTENKNFVASRLAELRLKLIDLTRRNPLINFNHSETGVGFLRIVHEVPDVIKEKILNESMSFIPLPDLNKEPLDEASPEFTARLTELRMTDQDFISIVNDEGLKLSDPVAHEQTIESALRNLKNKVREELNLEPLQNTQIPDLRTHARLHGINPNYELGFIPETEEHEDNFLQTLLTPAALDRRLRNIYSKYTSYIRESGINVLHICFGFLEYPENKISSKKNLSPILTVPLILSKTKKKSGLEYSIEAEDDRLSLNQTLVEKLRIHHDIAEFPEILSDMSIQTYLEIIQKEICNDKNWKVRNYVTICALPFSTISIYEEMFPEAWSQNQLQSNKNISQLLGGTAAGSYSFSEDIEDIDRLTLNDEAPPIITQADSSQHSAIYEALKGDSLVIQGPPGTGKSQTITNLIAAYCSQGKRVLFVAEKQSALNVVSNRLRDAGLGALLIEPQRVKNKEHFLESLKERLSMDEKLDGKSYLEIKSHLKTQIQKLNLLKDTFAIKTKFQDLSLFDLMWRCTWLKIKNDKTLKIFRSKIPDVLEFSNLELQSIKNDISYFFQNKTINSDIAINKSLLGDISGDAISSRISYNKFYDLSRIPEAFIKLNRFLNENLISINLSEVEDLFKSNVKGLIFTGESKEKIVQKEKSLSLKIIYFNNLEFLENILISFNRSSSSLEFKEFEQLYIKLGISSTDIFSEQIEAEKSSQREHINILKLLKSFAQSFLGNKKITFLKVFEILDFYRNLSQNRFEFKSDYGASYQPSYVGEVIRNFHDVQERVLRDLYKVTGRKHHKVALSIGLNRVWEIKKIVEKSSFLSFLSTEFRNAIKDLKAIGFSGEGKTQAKNFADSLIHSLQEIEEFESNKQFKAIFGDKFQGLNTDENLVSLTRSRLADISDLKTKESALMGGDVSDNDRSEIFSFIASSVKNWNGVIKLKSIYLEKNILEKDLDLLIEAIDEKKVNLDRLEILAGKVLNHKNVALNINHIYKEVRSKFSQEDIPFEQELSLEYLLCYLLKSFEEKVYEGASYSGREESLQKLEREFENYKRLFEFYGILESFFESKNPINIQNINDLLPEICEYFLEFSSSDSSSWFLDLKNFLKEMGIAEPATGPELELLLNDIRLIASLDEAQFFAESKRIKFLNSINSHPILKNINLDELAKVDSADLAVSLIEEKIIDAYLRCRHEKYKKAFENLGSNALPAIQKLFRSYDAQLKKLEVKKILTLAKDSHIPKGISFGPKKNFTDLSLIQNELNKQKGHIPIRQLILRSRNALLAMKPVWLMQPISVSQFLPRESEIFDVLIIDEASQMLPEYAICSINRAKQIIVVGDSQQMPPSNLFNVLNESEDDEEPEIDAESILDLAATRLGNTKALRVHYRSRHSSLISFSNKNFYRDSLIVAPSPVEDRRELGVFHVHVNDAHYEAGLNIPEAKEVLVQLKQCIANYPNQSIGIVTSNLSQMKYLEEELNRLRDHDPIFSEYWDRWDDNDVEYPMLTNLERVQGQERDIIIVSTVYGPDKNKNGRVFQRFPLINSSHGHRRLNVLFTRAKNRLILVSSLRPSDIDISSGVQNLGKKILRNYIEYASNAPSVDSDFDNPVLEIEPDSDFELSVIRNLQRFGFTAIPQVGVGKFRIDIGVKHKDYHAGFLAGIECDGATYHSSPAARERDAIRQDILEGLGWKIYRVWSTDWFENPEFETRKLIDWLTGLMSNRSEKLSSPNKVSADPFSNKSTSDAKGNDSSENPLVAEQLQLETFTRPPGVRQVFTQDGEEVLEYYEECPGVFQVWDGTKLLGWIERQKREFPDSKELGSYGRRFESIETPIFTVISEVDSSEYRFDTLTKALKFFAKLL